jgi:esterase/lipase superfamily enzyme
VRYRADQNEVTGQAINDLADLLLKLRAVGDLDSDNPARIHIIGHSLGCRFIAQALQRLHLLKTTPPTVLDQAIFAAPDLDVVDFIARIGEGSTVANGVTVYGSERDGALMMSKGFNGDLPRAGFALDDLARCGIQTVDASALRGDLLGMGHDKYVSAVDDIRAILWKDLSHAQRAPLFDIREVGAHALYVMRANNDLNWLALSDALSCVRSFGADAVQVLHTALETDGRLTGDVAERARRALILTERLLANQPLFPA